MCVVWLCMCTHEYSTVCYRLAEGGSLVFSRIAVCSVVWGSAILVKFCTHVLIHDLPCSKMQTPHYISFCVCFGNALVLHKVFVWILKQFGFLLWIIQLYAKVFVLFGHIGSKKELQGVKHSVGRHPFFCVSCNLIHFHMIPVTIMHAPAQTKTFIRYWWELVMFCTHYILISWIWGTVCL